MNIGIVEALIPVSLIVSEEIGLVVLMQGIEVRCAARVLWCQVGAHVAVRGIFHATLQ